MVVPRSVHNRPLVCTGRVLTARITQSCRAVSILINFSPYVSEVNYWGRRGQMRYLVTMMDNAPLVRELDVRESGVVVVAGARLTEVDH